jgi:hypothetical protein
VLGGALLWLRIPTVVVASRTAQPSATLHAVRAIVMTLSF